MQRGSDFLFVNCDGHQARIHQGERKDLNRHVQYTCRRHDPRRWTTATPLPRQIKFSSLSRRSNSPRKRKRVPEASTVVEHTGPGPLDLALPLYQWESPTECRFYDYYTKVVAHNIFCDKSSQFWQTYILQSCHQLPVVMQSLIALSAAFRETDDAYARPSHVPSKLSESPSAALSKAISMLRAYISLDGSPSHAVVLTCAIILYAYAKVLGDQQAASTHLERAIHIFDTWAMSFAGREKPDDFRTI
ncbi:hypothetical protein M409DRAFT_48425 [Zasmidium cellare ATCC 36951]|uniref:Transcription factor domain-containing protein n=1 Tax=Zasmidium cellare ATCC 36951 TaxID=1080233 RepID=A0A6A6D1Z9_ZASCE|nr:uncharacterized protein M409DRAFT_48425 [Zasmidium cellare ATCC 36951]KAF2173447.1 hypothetical protein M409DRAFT_48425 [Zasmidium cellare ATCC 36951]